MFLMKQGNKYFFGKKPINKAVLTSIREGFLGKNYLPRMEKNW